MNYNTGKSTEIPEEREELEKAIADWSEGNEHLGNALKSCIENDVPTLASCSGHKHEDGSRDPYIVMVMTDENRGTIFNIINQLYLNRGGIRELTLCTDYENGTQRTTVGVHMKNASKDRMFDLVAGSSRKSIELESAEPLVQDMVKLSECIAQTGMRHDFAYVNLGMIKMLNIFASTDVRLKNIYDRELGVPFSNLFNNCSKTFLSDHGFIKFFGKMVDKMKKFTEPPKNENNYAEKESGIKYSGIYKAISTSLNKRGKGESRPKGKIESYKDTDIDI